LDRGPNYRSSNDDRLRHLYADALQLNVIFQPKKGWMPIKARDGKSHTIVCETRKHKTCTCKKDRAIAYGWLDNPVWGHAPPNGKYKAGVLTNLLTTIVVQGHLIDLTHDLMRLAIIAWHCSIRNFKRLVKRIRARIALAVKGIAMFQKSPEPEEGSRALTSNPAFCRVNWYCTRLRILFKKSYVPRYIPPHRRKWPCEPGPVRDRITWD